MAWLGVVNVLLTLLHAPCFLGPAIWLEEQNELKSVLICRVAQMGALRILTNPRWLKDDVMSDAEFWRGWDTL